ncbi:hypothetical protein GEMRC1_008748 [Eukaryota sp. GEM-RC1]
MTKRAQEVEKELSDSQKQLNLLKNQHYKLKSILDSNLLLQQVDLEKKLLEIQSNMIDSQSVSLLADELANVTSQVEMLEQKVSDARDEDQELRAKKDQFESNIENLKSSSSEVNVFLQSEGAEMDRLLTERSSLLQKKDDLQRKLRDIGAVDMSIVTSCEDATVNQLNVELSKVNIQLKKFSHVNKKALEQFVTFSEQRDSMIRKREELIKGEESITDLIDHLDRQKSSSIEKTFETIASHFSDVFKEIVPNGYANLEFLTDDNQDLAGLAVKVSFSGRGDVYLMEQLSGGQKSVVALSLIFAIQRCDMAPFYLFDELDAALDDQYRSAVARMIKKMTIGVEQNGGCQVISTTFRPELIEAGDQHYIVSLRNKISTIRLGDVNDCLQLIQDLPENSGGNVR